MLFSLFYGGAVPTQEQLGAVDFTNFIDSTNPDFYLFNIAGNTFLKADVTVDLNVLYHSRVHIQVLCVGKR